MPGYLTSQLQSSEALAAAASQRQRLRDSYGHLLSDLQAGPLLEIGPGRGELLEVLSRALPGNKRSEICAVDIDSEVASHIRKTHPDVTTVHQDPIQFIRGGDRQFAAVFMLHVLEHLKADYAVNLLSEIRQHLRSGGLLVIEVPNTACSHVGTTIQSSDITHKVAYTSISLKQVCTMAGFDNIEIAGIRPRGNSPARLAQRTAIALLIQADRLRHKIFLPSWRFLHEPTIYAVCRAI